MSDDRRARYLAKLDADPAIRQAVLARMERDAELAARTGQPMRKDVQLARKIIATDPDKGGGFSDLFAAWKKGAAVPVAALAPLASLLQQQAEDRRGE